MSNSDQRIELLEDPGSTTPLDYEKLYLEKQYQIKESILIVLLPVYFRLVSVVLPCGGTCYDLIIVSNTM